MGPPSASKSADGGGEPSPAIDTPRGLIGAMAEAEGGETKIEDLASDDDEEEDRSINEFVAGGTSAAEALSPALSSSGGGGWGFIRSAPAFTCAGDGVPSPHEVNTMPFEASKGHWVVRWPCGV